jgi:hypothetical protein
MGTRGDFHFKIRIAADGIGMSIFDWVYVMLQGLI